jgi:dinuclear metal center YbgI/SA1388 family protein
MVELNVLVNYADDLLRVASIQDYCPNGLQVEGNSKVKKIVCAVTASEDAIEEAIAAKADVLLVHHGYFWKGERPNVVGMKRKRLQLLLKNNISLLAYHLPLDVHQTLGNNVMLAQRLGFDVKTFFDVPGTASLGAIAELRQPHTAKELLLHLQATLLRQPLHISSQSNKPIKKVAWITGAAQDYIDVAKAQGCDAFISGEVSERTYYAAKELDIHYFAAGHHATERYGVQALAKHLSNEFGLTHAFVDAANPV